MKYNVITSGCLCVVAFLLIGCGPSQYEARQQTSSSANAPTLVAENTPKGKLWRIDVTVEGTIHKHYVYYFDKSTNTVSINYMVPNGKTSRIQTVVIGGEEYIPKPKKYE